MLASQGFDVQVRLTHPQRIPRLEHEAYEVPGITTMEGWFQAEGVPLRADGSEGDSVVVSALPADTEIFVPDMVGGRWLEPEDTNAIVVPASLLSAEPGLGLGEELTLMINDEETTWLIVGLNEVFQPPIAPKIVYVNLPQYWRLMGNTGRANNVRVLTEDHDAATHAAAAQELEQRLEVANFEVRSMRTATEDRDVLTERFNIITIILMVMAFLMATVGAMGLMGTMSINVLERTREIGVMRAIGASTRSILLIFLVEGVADRRDLVGGRSRLVAANEQADEPHRGHDVCTVAARLHLCVVGAGTIGWRSCWRCPRWRACCPLGMPRI